MSAIIGDETVRAYTSMTVLPCGDARVVRWDTRQTPDFVEYRLWIVGFSFVN